MTYTASIEATEFLGAVKHRNATVDITGYDTGGETITPNDVGLNRFQWVHAYVRDGSNYIVQFDETTNTLTLRDPADGTEAAAGTALEVRFVGAGK